MYFDLSTKRNMFEIIKDILTITKKRKTITPILYKANLSHYQSKKYLEYLINQNLLEYQIIEKKNFYKTTPKGINFLSNFHDLEKILTSHLVPAI